MRVWRLLGFAAVLYGAATAWQDRAISRVAGVLVPFAPMQSDLPSPVPAFEHHGFRIIPLQTFALEARVLSVEPYWFDHQAALSPVDLALGWGPMSDSAVLDHIDISQGGRFYHWHVDAFPIPRRDIEINSANMHLIPANAEIERTLKRVRRGHIVTLAGMLIEARSQNGWLWRSSLTREDTGAGACELVWITGLALR
jgi:hypothetical protein